MTPSHNITMETGANANVAPIVEVAPASAQIVEVAPAIKVITTYDIMQIHNTGIDNEEEFLCTVNTLDEIRAWAEKEIDDVIEFYKDPVVRARFGVDTLTRADFATMNQLAGEEEAFRQKEPFIIFNQNKITTSYASPDIKFALLHKMDGNCVRYYYIRN